MRICQTLGRGFTAAHGALIGALFLFLLHAPVQVLSTVAQGIPEAARGPGQQPDPSQVALRIGVGCGTFLFSLAVFFLFPLVLGGILGRVRDRLEPPGHAPGTFFGYGQFFYSRLLGSQALATLAVFVLLLPVMVYAMWLAMEVAALGSAAPDDAQQVTRSFLTEPVLLTALLVLALLASAVGMVYWVANCVVVAEGERVIASWRRALRFCRENLAAVLVLWLVNLAAGLVMSPFALLGSKGIVTDVGVLVPLAVIYAALIAYWGVVLAGLVMSLYLAGRPPAGRSEVKELVLMGPN